MKRFSLVAAACLACGCLGAASSAFSADLASGAAAAPAPRKERGTPDLLMFTVDEINDIQAHWPAAELIAKPAARSRSGRCNALPFHDPLCRAERLDDMDQRRSHTNQGFQAFQVTEISPTSVELLVPLSAQGVRPVRLQPNQTFVTKTAPSWKESILDGGRRRTPACD